MDSDLIDLLRDLFNGEGIVEILGGEWVDGEDPFLSQIQSLLDFRLWNYPLLRLGIDIFGEHLEALVDVFSGLLVLLLIGLSADVELPEQSHVLSFKVASFTDAPSDLTEWLPVLSTPLLEFIEVVPLSNLPVILHVIDGFLRKVPESKPR